MVLSAPGKAIVLLLQTSASISLQIPQPDSVGNGNILGVTLESRGGPQGERGLAFSLVLPLTTLMQPMRLLVSE